MVASMPRHRFSIEDYERMVAAGILREDDRVELIQGEIIVMSPIGPPHNDAVAMLTRLVVPQVASDVLVMVQGAIRLPTDSEPQPDLALVRFRRYREALPAAENVLLVIEVSDTTLAYDRDTKLPLYAAAGIPEAWLVDLPGGRIERHSEPSEDGYRVIVRFGRGSVVTSTVIPGLEIPVDTVVGDPE